jgi:dienelactone hydrolase
MASWGVEPRDVARRFSEEALVELVPALYTRRMRESTAYQLAQLTGALPGAGAAQQPAALPSSPKLSRDGRPHVTKYPSGRTGRTYGSAREPLTGAALEAAIRDVARHESSRNVRAS